MGASIFFVCILFGLLPLYSDATNTITAGQFVTDGQTIISAEENFELGFFSPVDSKNRYVGIWYHKIPTQTVVWVANRENPILNGTGALTLTDDGNLEVLDGDGKPLWSTNISVVHSNSSALLMDSGNLILTSGEDKYLWQSFNDPTDTYLSGMEMGYIKTGENNIFSSWKSADDPSKGNYSMGVDSMDSPQILIWKGSTRYWRTGQWDGQTFLGVPNIKTQYLYGFELVRDAQKGLMYFTYSLPNNSDVFRYRIRWDGGVEMLQWNEEKEEWILVRSEPTEDCEIFSRCGAFGRCNTLDSPICSCIHGFEPKDINEWNRGNWSGGCARRTALQCERTSEFQAQRKDGFLTLEGIKLPDFSNWASVNGSVECEDECMKNCSCSAYTYLSGVGCMIWTVDLVDVQQFQEDGNTIYIRLADSDLIGGNSGISKPIIVIIAIFGAVFLSLCVYLLWRFIPKLRELSRKRDEKSPFFALSNSGEVSSANFSVPDDIIRDGQQGNVPELPLFNFDCVAVATNNFSNANKLGQGGFGPVYKGMLPEGQEIAVKRLSRGSIQGLEEFKTEIILIAKLQHRNLVRLLGCCIQGEEKMLIYEYMPNCSLDSFIFDPAKQGQLDWRKRFHIIEGIARGLLYLHRDSRLRIIHRDLKASNILLDDEMNPKISDFGMARIFGGSQNHANTNRVVGTYGYMSPEYAMEGIFSVKSDVYSFGVLLLEIVSGRRNSYVSDSEHYSKLIGYAWNLWSEGKEMEFVDSTIVDTCSHWEVLRCIHVGLLCVQYSAMERPTIPSVLMMLESETASVPMPAQPTFHVPRNSIEDSSTSYVTVTTILGR